MKVAIVTGATGNLGKSVVGKFINEGFRVIGTILPNDPIQLNFPLESFEAREVDLTDREATQLFIEGVIAKEDRIDAVVLTVGGFAIGNISDTSITDILIQYQLNFETAYNIAKPAFLQMMQQNNGRIFFIGSKAGINAANSRGMVAYGLGKSLLFRLAEMMNEESRGRNVVSAVVVPSIIDTPQNRKNNQDENFDDWVKPEDIANIIYYHTTDEAKVVRDTVIKAYNNA
jgi:NAD(P)-dependent dehydrogenase (short-subunit alcohol dehydrogenase family)